MGQAELYLQPEYKKGKVIAGEITVMLDCSSFFGSNEYTNYLGEKIDSPKSVDSVGNSKYIVDKAFDAFFKNSYQKLDDMDELEISWDTYGAEPPNKISIDNAKIILKKLYSEYIKPDRITPSAEGGIAISFINDNYYADFECFNDGEIYLGQSTSTNVDAVELVSFNSLEDKIKQLWAFINGNTGLFTQ